MGNPCGWTVTKCGCGTCWNDLSPAVQERAAAFAIGLVWAATGRRYGPCEVTVMPINPRVRDRLYQTFPVAFPAGRIDNQGMLPAPVLELGEWRNLCGGSCGCRSTCTVPLPPPVDEVVEVLVDGEPVDPAAYRVDNAALLIRTDGDCWPTCQRLDTPVPVFQVTYTRGDPIPTQVQTAVELLACEYGRLFSAGSCKLPNRLSSLTRQGVEVTMAEAAPSGGGFIRTGIQTVDDAIASVNPYGLTQAPTVWSPDMPDPRTTTWLGGS